jgi:hypothetical protein
MIESIVANRRAVEAIRAGVPNGDAVRALSSYQPHIVSAFDDALNRAFNKSGHDPGFVVSGAFGAGKSHLVEELQQRALSADYVSSKVSISKETPLHLPARMVQAAVRAMASTDKPQGLLLDIVMSLQTDRLPFREFQRWCGTAGSGISPLWGSLLELRAAAGPNSDVADLLVRYWSGGAVTISAIRSQLKAAGLNADVPPLLAIDRPWETIRFLARLCQERGFRGWVIFLDETELISKYGPISRARAYEQLGRWLGIKADYRIPGTAVVATVINDFVPQVLDMRGDRWQVPELLGLGRRRADLDGVPFAVGAIEAITDAMRMEQLSLEHLEEAQAALRQPHSRAYHWDAPPLQIEYRNNQPMRLYVRRWINEWDLRRLYPDTPLDFQGEEVDINYDEDEDIATEPWGEG